MTVGENVWRARIRWWVPALVFLVANVVLLSAYRLVLAGQSQLRSSRIERTQTDLARTTAERRELERKLEAARSSRDAIERFYDDRLASENVRLTRILAEVRELATRAGLAPTAIKYGKEEIDDHGLLRRSIEFSVEGSYVQFRRFVNMLELSSSFLVLERVGLRGSDDEAAGELRIALAVSTLFASPEAVAEAEHSGGST